MKKNTYVGVGIILLLIVSGGVYQGIRINETPRQILQNKYEDFPAFNVQEVITEVGFVDKRNLIIYYNQKGTLACSLFQKTFLGYKEVCSSGELAAKHENRPIGIMFSSYDKGGKWIIWGIAYDEAAQEVVVDGREMDVIDSAGLRLFYLLGEDEIDFDSEHIEVFDDQGRALRSF